MPNRKKDKDKDKDKEKGRKRSKQEVSEIEAGENLNKMFTAESDEHGDQQ